MTVTVRGFKSRDYAGQWKVVQINSDLYLIWSSDLICVVFMGASLISLNIAHIDFDAGIISLEDKTQWMVAGSELGHISLWHADHSYEFHGNGTIRELVNHDHGSRVRVIQIR